MQFKIEIEDEPFMKGTELLFRCKGFNSLVFDVEGLKKLASLNPENKDEIEKELTKKRGLMMNYLRQTPSDTKSKITEDSIVHKIELTSNLKIGESVKVVINTKYDENEEVEFLVAYKDDKQIGLLPRYPFITKHSMNATNTTEGGYEASKMKNKILPEYERAIKEVFENELVSFDLLSKEDVFDDDKKLELFKEYPRYINEEIDNAYDEGKIGSWSWWLRSVTISTYFANVSYYGYTDYSGASFSLGVRPLGLFALKK